MRRRCAAALVAAGCVCAMVSPVAAAADSAGEVGVSQSAWATATSALAIVAGTVEVPLYPFGWLWWKLVGPTDVLSS
ncbi:hypothetical protein [Corynebacterium aquilae]|uniref:Uncharacterized protein n=1 Tax=Corynebacterium aquilae DSM 44791 TaxID=1431546 RepID=A0A1L7CD92_9CORY|nr:hypothetical protein [Corynebacterium aquilae]APT83808.1 hypothetical protein CAQU_00440 [Corynebacterium aquilae DSM 44791]